MKYFTLLLLFLCSNQILKSQSTDDIILQHIQAIGGEENWNKIKTIQIKSRTSSKGNLIHLTKSAIKDSAVRNDIRIEYKRAEYFDQKYYMLINGNKGWSYLPEDRNNTIYTLYPSEIAELNDELDFEDPFLRYKDKGREIQLLDIENYKGVEYYKFEITYKTKNKVLCYMNTSSFMIELVCPEGQPEEFMKRYVNYTTLPEGIVVPMNILGIASDVVVEHVEINPTFSSDLFEPSVKNGWTYFH